MVRKVAYMLLVLSGDALSVYDGSSVGADEGVLVGDVDGMNDGGDVVGDAVGAWVCSRTDACSCG